jgi:hypothetical protein
VSRAETAIDGAPPLDPAIEDLGVSGALRSRPILISRVAPPDGHTPSTMLAAGFLQKTSPSLSIRVASTSLRQTGQMLSDLLTTVRQGHHPRAVSPGRTP